MRPRFPAAIFSFSVRRSCIPLIRSYPCSRGFSSVHAQTVSLPHHYYSNKRPTPVSLKMMLDHAGDRPTPHTLVRVGKWIREELPIRLAVQIKSIDKLPYGLCLMPSVRRIRKWYIESINELHAFPKIRNFEDELQFAALLKNLFNKHSKTLIAMAKGLQELKKELSSAGDIDVASDVDVTQFLDEFYMSRIGIRMLVGQHLALHEQLEQPVKGFVGIICTNTSPAQVAQDAIHDARYMCTRAHDVAPEVVFHGTTDLSFPFVPSHLYYVLFELLKNSMRAVTELHRKGVNGALPPVHVIIADSKQNEDVAIKISDEGGGIKRSHYPRIWSYLYTTAPVDFGSLSSLDEPEDFGTQAPLAGLGCGLPLSRLYARYFGGDLQLISMEGYGTDAYLHLPRLGDKCEPFH
jgi:pyruvate dehydrogenase kinase 2/3/4